MKKCILCLATIVSIGVLSASTAFAQEDKSNVVKDKNVVIEERNTEKEVLANIETRTRQQYGTIMANGVRLRKTPGLSGIVLRQLNYGDEVTLMTIQERKVDGYWWHCIRYNGITGWVAVNYVDGL